MGKYHNCHAQAFNTSTFSSVRSLEATEADISQGPQAASRLRCTTVPRPRIPLGQDLAAIVAAWQQLRTTSSQAATATATAGGP